MGGMGSMMGMGGMGSGCSCAQPPCSCPVSSTVLSNKYIFLFFNYFSLSLIYFSVQFQFQFYILRIGKTAWNFASFRICTRTLWSSNFSCFPQLLPEFNFKLPPEMPPGPPAWKPVEYARNQPSNSCGCTKPQCQCPVISGFSVIFNFRAEQILSSNY